MKLKIFACPECKCRKFHSLNGLNVHMTKSHTLNYKLIIKENKVFRKLKNQRGKVTILLRSNLAKKNHSKLGHK